MGIRVKTNTAALSVQKKLQDATARVTDNFTRLASGERINRAKDDAAGLAITERMRANLRAVDVAKRNALDGVSLLQTAEGGLIEVSNILIRLRELAIQASSDTVGEKERSYLNGEFTQLKDEIDRIASNTEFNGVYMLIGKNDDLREKLGQAELELPMELQIGPSYNPEMDSRDEHNPVNILRMDIQNINCLTYGDGSLKIGKHDEGTQLTTKEQAKDSLAIIDEAITRTSTSRAYIGATQSRVQHAINYLALQYENLGESKSRIRDADYAKESAEVTQNTIIQQAGASVLAQANSLPKIAVSLLNSMT